MKFVPFVSSLIVLTFLFSLTLGQQVDQCNDGIVIPHPELQALLPQSLPFDDSAHEPYLADAQDPFITPAERSDFHETAIYAEVTDFFTRLADESDFVQVKSLVTLANGEELWMVTVSGEQKFSADTMTKPIVFATAAIHAGESSGVNAGMMFVRNLVMNEEYRDLLDGINFLFIPVLNIQGYLRQSANGRINQHGPNTSGRRANAQFYNLNRDFAKLDTPEIRAVVGVMNDYDLAFYTDLHSTDGLNYQPDVTWCDNGDAGLSDSIYAWLRSEMAPDLTDYLESMNHIPGPCYYANNGMDPTQGSYPYYSDGPAYSGNYADHRQIPAYLLEIHSLKPNKQRVLGAYAFLHGINTIIAAKADSLRVAIDADKAARVDPVPIAWDYDDPAPTMDWPLFNWTIQTNPVLNVTQIVWSDDPITITVEESVRSTPLNPPDRPYGYIIPAVWTETIKVLKIHGIEMEVFTEDADVQVMNYRISDYETGLREGRPVMTAGTPVAETCTRTYLTNDVMIKTDQDLGTLAVALLDPVGEGSLLYWGNFASAFTSHEYAENYIMIPLAEKMLVENPEIAAEWETYKAENPMYDADQAIDWFFRRSALYDTDSYVYPVGIVTSDPGQDLPLAPISENSVGDDDETIAVNGDDDHDHVECDEPASSSMKMTLGFASVLSILAVYLVA